CQQGYISPRTF
nr:immunoglobulin light chain junction region [Macaca mulatta]